jgi:hypothetical protein
MAKFLFPDIQDRKIIIVQRQWFSEGSTCDDARRYGEAARRLASPHAWRVRDPVFERWRRPGLCNASCFKLQVTKPPYIRSLRLQADLGSLTVEYSECQADRSIYAGRNGSHKSSTRQCLNLC